MDQVRYAGVIWAITGAACGTSGESPGKHGVDAGMDARMDATTDVVKTSADSGVKADADAAFECPAFLSPPALPTAPDGGCP